MAGVEQVELEMLQVPLVRVCARHEACTRARFNALRDEIVLPALAARLSCVVFEPMMAAMVLKSPVRE